MFVLAIGATTDTVTVTSIAGQVFSLQKSSLSHRIWRILKSVGCQELLPSIPNATTAIDHHDYTVIIGGVVDDGDRRVLYHSPRGIRYSARQSGCDSDLRAQMGYGAGQKQFPDRSVCPG